MYLYDKLAWNRRLALDIQMREGNGVVANDFAHIHHPMATHGTPAWTQHANGLIYLDFEAGTPDWLDCGAVATADLDYTAGAFSLATWINYESVGFRFLMCRGVEDADGWIWAIDTDSALWLETNQAGAHQHSTSAIGAVPLATWTFLTTVRSGANVYHYINGALSLGTAGVHVDPLTAARELHIGINDAEAAGFMDGALWRPRIWSTALGATTIAKIYEVERGMMGV